MKVWGDNTIGYDSAKQSDYNWQQQYDVITLFGVIEHLVNPVVTLSELVMQLNPNGYLVSMLIVNDSGIPYRYKPPEHLTYWTRRSVELLYEKCGLEMVAYQPCDMYERLSIVKEKMWRKLSPIAREKVMPANDGDDFEYILVPTNNVITIGRKQ